MAAEERPLETSLVNLENLCRVCARLCVDNPELSAISLTADDLLGEKLRKCLKIKVKLFYKFQIHIILKFE